MEEPEFPDESDAKPGPESRDACESRPRRSGGPGAGAATGALEASETGWADSPIESPEIALAASAMAPAAMIPLIPRRIVRTLSRLVTGSP